MFLDLSLHASATPASAPESARAGLGHREDARRRVRRMPPEGGPRGTRQRRGGRPRGAGRTQAVGVTCIRSTGAWRAPAVGILSALGSRLSALGSRLSALGSRLSALGSRLSALGSRLSALGSRLSALGSRLSALGSRLSALGSRLSALGSRLSALYMCRAQGPRFAARRRPERVAPPRAQPGNRELRQCPRGRQLPPVGCRLTPAGPEERAGALSSRNRQSRCHLPPSSVSFARTARGRSVIARNCPLPRTFGTYHAVERRRDVSTSFGALVRRWRSLHTS